MRAIGAKIRGFGCDEKERLLRSRRPDVRR
jgi:hypothetical protein